MCLVIFGLGGVWSACHRPLPLRDQIPSYPGRPVAADTDVENILAGYADRVGPVPASAKMVLDAKAVRRLALENNPNVLLAKGQVESAGARLLTSGAWPNPELDGLYLMDGEGAFSSETTFRFALPLGGRVGAAEELAAREVDLARLNLVAARRQALSQADRLLARLVHARSRVLLLRSLADRSKKYAELARSRRTASMADPLDVALILADARTDRRAVQRAQTKVLELEQELRLQLGMPPEGGEFDLGEQRQMRLIETQADLRRQAAQNNTAVMRSRLKVLIAEHKAARISAERVPDLQLGPALTTEGENVAVGISLGLPIPLLQTGRGPYEEAQAERRLAEEVYLQAVRAAITRVTTGLSEFHSLERELKELRGEAGEALDDAVALAEVRYTAGKLDVLRLLLVHRAFAELKHQNLSLLLKIHEAVIDLRDAVGRSLKVEEVIP